MFGNLFKYFKESRKNAKKITTSVKSSLKKINKTAKKIGKKIVNLGTVKKHGGYINRGSLKKEKKHRKNKKIKIEE